MNISPSLFFNLEFRTWYGGAVREAVVNSNIVARDYENEIQAEIISDTQFQNKKYFIAEGNVTVINNKMILKAKKLESIRDPLV